jgi:hypothetical protein
VTGSDRAAICDFLTTTAEVRIVQLTPKGAKPYCSAEMMLKLFQLMDIHDLDLPPTWTHKMTREKTDELYFAYFHAFAFAPLKEDRPSLKEKRPKPNGYTTYVPRAGITQWLSLLAMVEPVCLGWFLVIFYGTNPGRRVHTIALIVFWLWKITCFLIPLRARSGNIPKSHGAPFQKSQSRVF